MIEHKHWAIGFWACAFAVLVLALAPDTDNVIPGTGWDKSNHVLAFAVLAVFGCRAYASRTLAILVGLVCYGVILEVLQAFTPYHFAQFNDVVGDVFGIVLGYAIHRYTDFRRGSSM